MRLLRWALALSLVGALLLVGCGGDDDAPPAEPTAFDADRAFADLRAQVEIGPRPAGSAASRRLTTMLAARLREAGVEDVAIQRQHRNVIGTIPGQGDGFIVVGAHHDTKDDVGPDFVGANDGASGVAVVLELARTLPRPMPGPRVAIALFDAEETRGDRPFEIDGMRGSRQYVDYAQRGEQGTPPLDEIEAMVLFDMVGDCDLQIPREAGSSERLYSLFAEAANGPPFEGTTLAILDDHIPFLEAGIEAVNIIDFNYGPGPSPGAWWHSEEDTLDKVCPESLAAVGEAALEAIPRIHE